MNEIQLYSIIKPMLIKQGFIVQRFEQEHIPDVYCFNIHKILWIELKCSHSKNEEGLICPHWRIGQLAWIKRHQSLLGDFSVALCFWYKIDYAFLVPKEGYKEEEIETTFKEDLHGFTKFIR
ncbi:MAG: hypothetical protein QXO70_02685 [Candidatus Pacearchaeota archaeon]